MSWTQDKLLLFMQRNAKHFGRDVIGIESASIEWVCKKFTRKIINLLDWTQVYNQPYVKTEYEGKGDIRSIKARNDFCLSPDQCVEIANFIAGKMPEGTSTMLDPLTSFSIIQYINRGQPIYTNWIGILGRLANANCETEIVRHGFWMRSNRKMTCSRCLHTYWENNGEIFSYCPACGARMDSALEEER